MSDDNRLEDSRLDADHIDRLTRELAAMRERAEKAEAIVALAKKVNAFGAKWISPGADNYGYHGNVSPIVGTDWNNFVAALDELSTSHTLKGTT